MTRTARRTLAVGMAATLLAVALAACSASAAPDASPTPSGPGTAACEKHGGTVEARQPTYGTNNDRSSWVELGDPVEVCRFQTLHDADHSRMYVDLVTISSPHPTLAALAYLAEPPVPKNAVGNPATALCISIGGAISYGGGANGGGLVDTKDPDDPVISTCVFADGSFIEEWGLAYHSDGTIRGIDLTKVFAFDQSDVPHIFAGSQD
jgi:putative hemolysin